MLGTLYQAVLAGMLRSQGLRQAQWIRLFVIRYCGRFRGRPSDYLLLATGSGCRRAKIIYLRNHVFSINRKIPCRTARQGMNYIILNSDKLAVLT